MKLVVLLFSFFLLFGFLLGAVSSCGNSSTDKQYKRADPTDLYSPTEIEKARKSWSDWQK